MEHSALASSLSEIKPPMAGAGFWIRAGARVIDTLVHNIVWYVAAIFVGIATSIYATLSGTPISQIFAKSEATSPIGFILALVGATFYHAISEYMYGASLGKLILKIHVKNDMGQPISLKASLIRSFAFFVDSIFLGLVAYGSMKSSPLNQRYGDKWANSVVVERAKLPQSQLPSGWKFLLAFIIAIVVDGLIAVLSTILDLL